MCSPTMMNAGGVGAGLGRGMTNAMDAMRDAKQDIQAGVPVSRDTRINAMYQDLGVKPPS